jgi:hypothetical protein
MVEPMIRLGVGLVALCVACTSGGDAPDGGVILPDSDIVEDSCYTVANTGCPQGHKCTVQWSEDGSTMELLVCGASGTVEAGQPCTIDAVTGVDDCIPRHVCIALDSEQRRCLRYCIEGSEICGDDTCMPLAAEGVLREAEGVCVP